MTMIVYSVGEALRRADRLAKERFPHGTNSAAKLAEIVREALAIPPSPSPDMDKDMKSHG